MGAGLIDPPRLSSGLAHGAFRKSMRNAREEFELLRTRGAIGADGRVALRSQNATLKRGRHVKYLPYAFTEHGAIMAAMVLSSPQAR